MDTFELFNNGKLLLPGKETSFAEMEWSKHPVFEGVGLKHIITAKDTDGMFSCHLVRIAPDCSIGNHIHETQLETHEVIKGNGKCINADYVIPYEAGTVSIMQAVALVIKPHFRCNPADCLFFIQHPLRFPYAVLDTELVWRHSDTAFEFPYKIIFTDKNIRRQCIYG